MPGSGINSTNVLNFKEKGFNAVHLSGVTMVQNLQNKPRVPMSSTMMISDVSIPVSSLEAIQEVVKEVK